MSTAQTSTAADVARRLCRGYNEWIKEHGPDAEGARAEGESLTVVYDGREYDVSITPRYMTDGYRFWVHRTCGLLNCTDLDHLVVVPAGEPAPSPEDSPP